MTIENNHYFVRLAARLMDFLFISLLIRLIDSILPSFNANLLLWFLIYNLIVTLLNGRTIGKYSFSLKIITRNKTLSGFILLITREFLFFLLLPILLINCICMAPLPLHDRISGTKVIKDER